MVVNNGEIILLSANILKIFSKDIRKVTIKDPSENMIWYTYLVNICDSLKPYLLHENNTKLQSKAIFYINIKLEILSFEEYTTLDQPELYDKTINFIALLLKDYYFYFIDITWVKYILLYYLDSSCYNFKEIKMPILSRELIDYLFNKILDKLSTSLDPGNPIGLEYGNSIQERFTQQNLSSFHTQSKIGTEIKNIVLLSLKLLWN